MTEVPIWRVPKMTEVPIWRVPKMTTEETLANEHWSWLVTLLEKVYKDAFIHGYKHGLESRNPKPQK